MAGLQPTEQSIHIVRLNSHSLVSHLLPDILSPHPTPPHPIPTIPHYPHHHHMPHHLPPPPLFPLHHHHRHHPSDATWPVSACGRGERAGPDAPGHVHQRRRARDHGRARRHFTLCSGGGRDACADSSTTTSGSSCSAAHTAVSALCFVFIHGSVSVCLTFAGSSNPSIHPSTHASSHSVLACVSNPSLHTSIQTSLDNRWCVQPIINHGRCPSRMDPELAGLVHPLTQLAFVHSSRA